VSLGLFNKDRAFFTVESSDVDLGAVLSQDVLSLEVKEETDKIDGGTLQLYDPHQVYSRILRPGALLSLSWGYLKGDASPQAVLAREFDSDELSGSLERRALRVFTMNPSGQGGQDGRSLFNCSFYALDQRGTAKQMRYRSGTKAAVVREVLSELGVSWLDVRFSRGSDSLGSGVEIGRHESGFRFLVRLARENRCVFKLGYSPTGQTLAMFLDPPLVPSSAFGRMVSGGTGRSNFFEWKEGACNVRSYSWQNHNGENGAGDHVQLSIVGGEVRITRYTVENDKVLAWRLKPEKIQAELQRRGASGGAEEKLRFYMEYIAVEDFERLKREGFFEPVEDSTAPQGYGYTASLECLGSPLHVVGTECQFGGGFPDLFRSTGTKFWLQAASHKIDRSGYLSHLEVVDSFSISPTGQVVI
jgi:hypothetical protein